jgi:phenylalanyl-tRNA synthetase beta chain
MKILYSQLQELIPDLSADVREAADVFTMIGYMCEKLEEVNYKGVSDYLLGLEIRENRPDCLSVLGLAKELAAYYGLGMRLPETLEDIDYAGDNLGIQVLDEGVVSRVVAVGVEGVSIKPSPDWLKEYLAFYDINSVNVLVDITNYVMLMTGEPSHAFDKAKIHGHLAWGMNKHHKEVTTLDETTHPIDATTLVIQDDKNPLSLSGIVGGDIARIDESTTSIIMEMAVYDRVTVMKNSRSMAISTEASRRHEKELDPNNLDFAFSLLVSMVSEYCGGKLSSQLYDYYPHKYVAPEISLDPSLPSIYAGVEIPEEQVEMILKNLGCEVKMDGKFLTAVPPLNRMDLQISEDLIEEVVRMYGFYHIPGDKVPALTVVPDITPRVVKLDEKIRDILSILGFDEILSWPLTALGLNEEMNYRHWSIVTTQNSVNEEFPELRQSLLIGLLAQYDLYQKNNLGKLELFEIGKVYGKSGDEYLENESLGIFMSGAKSLNGLKDSVEKLLRYLGIAEITLEKAKEFPRIANKFSCWDIVIAKHRLGIIYKLKPQQGREDSYFSEINLTELSDLLGSVVNNPIIELDGKLVSLDENIELAKDVPIQDSIEKLQKHMPSEHVWMVEVSDAYPLKDSVRYTLHVTYKGLSDQEAKKLHEEIFSHTPK